MENKFFVIVTNGDGDIGIGEYTENQLLKMLQEYEEDLPNIIDNVKNKYDPMYWGNSLLIIKGEIKIPKIKETVKKWSI